MKIQETAIGMAYSHKSTTIVFPLGAAPMLLFGKQLVPIVRPGRFGSWDTPKECAAFARNFTNARSNEPGQDYDF